MRALTVRGETARRSAASWTVRSTTPLCALVTARSRLGGRRCGCGRSGSRRRGCATAAGSGCRSAVAEERNFTHAARRLHLAQQAVSKTVAQLEAELGVPLLERTTRDVRLTAGGAALLRSGRALLAAAEDAFSEAQHVGHGRAGTVRVGVSPAVGPADAPP